MFRATRLQQYLASQIEGGGGIYQVTGLPAWILVLTWPVLEAEFFLALNGYWAPSLF